MNKQMENLMYLLLHFLTGQIWQSGLVVHDTPGMCLATAGAATPAAAADTARRLLAAWNACDGIPIAALEAGAVKNVATSLRAINDEFPPQAQVSFSLAGKLKEVDRALLPLNAPEAQPFSALLSVECVETALGFAPDDENSAPDFADDGEENDAAICAECGHSVAPGSGRFVNRALIFDDYDTRCEMGYSYPAGAYICPECEQAINEKYADY